MPELLSQKFRRGSGRTKCNICGKIIPRGTRYLDAVLIGDGHVYHWRECLICLPVSEALAEVWSWPDEGYGFDEIFEYVIETLMFSLTPPGFMVTWWRHICPTEPLPVEDLLATEGVDL